MAVAWRVRHLTAKQIHGAKIPDMATIRYLVHDVAASERFYTHYLGFVVHERWGTAFLMLAKDDLKLWISGPETSAAKPMPDGRVPVPGGWNRFVVAVKNLDQLVHDMRAAGMTFRNEVLDGPGGKQILADDPSGNPIELFEARVD